MKWILDNPAMKWLFLACCCLGALYVVFVLLVAVATWGDEGLLDLGIGWLWLLPTGMVLWTSGALLIYALSASVAYRRIRRGKPAPR